MGFFKWAIPGIFFFIFVFSKQLTVNNVKYTRRDSNRGPLVLEVTALPTEPQPLPDVFDGIPLLLLRFEAQLQW